MNVFRYRRRNVRIPSHADMPVEYKPGERLGNIVQKVLDSVDPWEKGDNPIATMKFEGSKLRLRAIVAENGDPIPRWGIHRGHKARTPQASPFINPRGMVSTNDFTVELVGTGKQPILVRAYPGGYIPPLPWQNSARDADGGCQA